MPKMTESELIEKWNEKWEDALALWSRFTKLKDPFYFTGESGKKKNKTSEDYSDTLAMILLDEHKVVINTKLVFHYGLEDFPMEILGHEIGHHVYCPGDLTGHGRMLGRVGKALADQKQHAPFISNLYSDLMINNRLKQNHGLRMEEVYKKLNQKKQDSLWQLYMRTYEILWALESETLAFGVSEKTIEADAQLCNRIIRSYAEDWLFGAGKFAAICYNYLVENKAGMCMKCSGVLMDTKGAGAGAEIPDGIMDIDSDEQDSITHPLMENERKSDTGGSGDMKGPSSGQFREPFEIGQILSDMGIKYDAVDLTIRYYKERAIPYLVPFPVKDIALAGEPIMEGTDLWDVSSPMENINWFQSALKSPVPIPGYTLVEDFFGMDTGREKTKEPVDLDIYVDCSGSMPNPGYNISYLALAGTIICISALRVGARVQATLWSGTGEYHTTKGFIRDEKEILKIVTGYIGGATAFPLNLLRKTYLESYKHDRKSHILHISDEGIDTMLDKDEKGGKGTEITEESLKNAGGGGTMVLNLYSPAESNAKLKKIAKMGYKIHRVNDWESLVKFAYEFSKEKYTEAGK
ncbi:MAG TPA: VWA domain-containing protein [Leptospiraceae bacterium]|nr:VWA domain-containing protein [Leptospiraceae bacterium]